MSQDDFYDQHDQMMEAIRKQTVGLTKAQADAVWQKHTEQLAQYIINKTICKSPMKIYNGFLGKLNQQK